jgi:hypothetical protein
MVGEHHIQFLTRSRGNTGQPQIQEHVPTGSDRLVHTCGDAFNLKLDSSSHHPFTTGHIVDLSCSIHSQTRKLRLNLSETSTKMTLSIKKGKLEGVSSIRKGTPGYLESGLEEDGNLFCGWVGRS